MTQQKYQSLVQQGASQLFDIQDPTFNWDQPILEPQQFKPLQSASEIDYRFFRITEISQDKADGYRLAMTNVLSILNDSQAAIAYLLNGTPKGLELYLGVVEQGCRAHAASRQLKSALEGNFPGVQLNEVKQDDQEFNKLFCDSQHLGVVQGVPSFNEQAQTPDQQDFQGIERLANSLQGEKWQMLVVAEPGQDLEIRNLLNQVYELSTELSVHAKQTVQQSESHGTQQSETHGTSQGTNTGWSNSTSENLTNSENTGSSRTKNIGTSTSIGSSKGSNSRTSSSSSNKNHSTNEGTSESFSNGSSISRSEGLTSSHSGGENTGKSQSFSAGINESNSLALTRERINKNIEEIQKHLSETMVERLRLGLSKGMFKTAIYLSAKNQQTFSVLAQSVRSIFQGNQASATPLIVYKLPNATQELGDLLQLRQQHLTQPNMAKNLLVHSLPFNTKNEILQAATWLNTRELALLTGLPSREIPGVRIRQSIDFALNTPEVTEHSLHLGHLVHHGRKLNHSPLELTIRDLNKHVFITGVTGSGKTTSCMGLLEASKLPFLVIEPAKTEYRALYARGQDVDYYLPGREDITPFRLNPFELVNERQNLAGHISTLAATLTTIYPMEAAMPQLVEESIILAYSEYGWDLHSGKNFFHEDPWSEDVRGACWPTFSDMINQLDGLIASKGMGEEFKEKYRGSLVARLTNLTLGVKGQMLNTRRSLDFNSLLDRKVVIELEELKSEQDKALFMGLIITRLAECMKERHRQDSSFQHLTLIEEAHRLLTRPEPGESDARKMGVEMFANLIAEVRKYGEGLIIADQIPNKLIPDVIKNTHTKIVHRLFAVDDRNTIGDAMSLSDEQKDFLPLLQTGETIVYCGGWHGSVRAQIEELTQTDATDLSEEKLKAKGQLQLWGQRNWLYPYLSKIKGVDSPDALAEITQVGARLLSLFINYLRESKGNTEITQRQIKMQASFQHLMDRPLTSQPNLQPMMLIDCLVELMKDSYLQPEALDKPEELELFKELLEHFYKKNLNTFTKGSNENKDISINPFNPEFQNNRDALIKALS